MAVKKSRESWGIIDSLPSGRFRARYTHLETRFSAPNTFESKTDARMWLTGQRADISRGVWKDPRKNSEAIFGPYAETWIKQRLTTKGLPLRPKTRVEYQRQLQVDLKVFLDEPINAVTAPTVRAWFAPRVKDAATAAARAARLLHAVYETAVGDGLVEKNPVAGNMTKAATGKKYRPPTLGELTTLIDHTPPRLRFAIILGAYGSARLSEWRVLRRDDIRFIQAGEDAPEYAVVRVTRQALWINGEGWSVGPTKSEAGEREVTLPSALTPAVRAHLEDHADLGVKGLLFPSTNHHEYLTDDSFRRDWDRARRAAKVMGIVREHDLRGFAGTQHAIAGGTIRETMAFLGHSTVQAAMAYQATTGREAELADRMAIPAALRA